jgi:carboxyl-terminal processing protease
VDVGVIVGSDRTYGKGLVQNVEVLPFNTALKFTVAKYYTPSGRCIQAVNYKEGGGSKAEDGNYQATKVVDGDRKTFYTKSGRVIKDGGGVEVDFKVDAPKASALEVTLLRSGVLDDFAADWSKNHELTNNFKVDEDTYRQFQAYVNEKQDSGDLKLDALYSGPLNDLKKALKKSGYKGSEKEVTNLQARIVQEVKNDFEKYRSDIKEDISQSILARYVPESMLIERSIHSDKQVQAAMELVASGNKFERLLAQGSTLERKDPAATLNMVNAADKAKPDGIRASVKW